MNLAAFELSYLRGVVLRQIDRPCAFSRSETGVEEFARITNRIRGLGGWDMVQVASDVDRLLAEGYFCEVCRWKLSLFAAFWCSEKLPFVAWRFRSQVPARSALQAAGRDLEAEIEAAIHPYRRIG